MCLDFSKIIDYDLRQSIDIPPVCGLSEVTKWKAHTVESMPGKALLWHIFIKMKYLDFFLGSNE